jgi:hypothetical protein
MFCGMHAINNLVHLFFNANHQLQLPEPERFTANSMNAIANDMHSRERKVMAEITDGSLPKIPNNHCSKMFYLMFVSFYSLTFRPTGNYSYEVISEALNQRGYNMDSVKLTEEWALDDPSVVGVICNVQILIPTSSLQPKSSPFDCIKSCFGMAETTIKQDGNNKYIRSGGHWFSVGKVYDTTDTPAEDTEVVAIGSDSEITSTAGSKDFVWYNHDSHYSSAQVLSDGIEAFVEQVKKTKELQMWRITKR